MLQARIFSSTCLISDQEWTADWQCTTLKLNTIDNDTIDTDTIDTNLTDIALSWNYILLILNTKKSKVQVFDTPQVINCFKVESDAALLVDTIDTNLTDIALYWNYMQIFFLCTAVLAV